VDTYIPLQTQPAEGAAIPGSYIVVLKDQPTGGFTTQAASRTASQVASEMALRYRLKVKRTYQYALKGFAAHIPKASLDDVKSDPRVLFISQNREVHATFPQFLPPGIDRIEADKSSTRAGNGSGSVRGVGIAVLDTGVDKHRDLNRAGGKDCVSSAGYGDAEGHGTHVAGIAAAEDNAFGVVGVAPGAPIYAVKVLDNTGFGTTATITCGIDWVTANAGKIEVANMSLGGPGSDDGACGLENRDAMHYAICRSVEEGITYVAAAGNNKKTFKKTTPAAYDEVLTATAMADFNGEPGGGGQPGPDSFCAPLLRDFKDDRAATVFSNFTTIGSPDVDHTIAAPGVCTVSTYKNGFYAIVAAGTSLASPHVAGTAALYKARHPDASPGRVIERLRAEAREQPASYGFRGDPRSPFGDRYYGYLVHAGDY
jgi:subtilisin